MNLEILTPQEKVYKGEIKLVKLPGSEGSFEILMNHAPIVSTLINGEIKVITAENEKLFFTIDGGGVVESSSNHIIILAEKIKT